MACQQNRVDLIAEPDFVPESADEIDWTGDALRRIRTRQKFLAWFAEPESDKDSREEEKLRIALERLEKLEEYVLWCREKHPRDKIPMERLLRCRAETIRAYLVQRKLRDENGMVPGGSFESTILDELEENGLALAHGSTKSDPLPGSADDSVLLFDEG